MEGLIVGIYEIVNTDTGQFYIGSSVNISKRWTNHRYLLNHNKHPNPHLQNAWNKYGGNKFQFNILIESNKFDIGLIETSMLQKHVGNSDCYNISSDASAPMRNKKHSEKTKLWYVEFHKNRDRTNQWKEFRQEKNNSIDYIRKAPIPSNAKLSPTQVKQIRLEYSTGTTSMQKLASQYNVDKKTVMDIINFKRFKDVI